MVYTGLFMQNLVLLVIMVNLHTEILDVKGKLGNLLTLGVFIKLNLLLILVRTFGQQGSKIVRGFLVP